MFFHADDSTICALSTAPGMGAIAMIRVSGPDAINLCHQLFSGDLVSAKSHTVKYGRFMEGERVVDEVVMTVFKGPNSFTGEDVIEIACHGSTYIQEEILRILVENGCRYAERGEFTFRAFFNRRMDLSQAEAVADLIAAESAGAHELALDQMRGGFSKEIAGLRKELINFASLIELELDFSEEDVEFADRTELTNLLLKINSVITALIDSFRSGNAIKNGVPVAIIGKPNAGKSTLLNALLNEERAIVSDIPGTTRDTIEDFVVIDGIKFRFIDTAGIRETEDVIEKIGVERSMNAFREANIITYLFDVNELSPSQLETELTTLNQELTEGQQLLIVGNKIDASKVDLSGYPSEVLFISSLARKGLLELQESLINVSNLQAVSKEHSIVTNVRHHEALSKARITLQEVLTGMETGIPGDLMAIDIRKALHHLGEITGEITTDDLLGNIFGKFCIGK
ncbi:tRNA uridine-5-carboxymethylaminomethyl(34) synthesis GTPase MnmE [Sanyastnella coralliicola]|uniref:tRNA uridine-5-carboxymethylaminomethyl(34) synthesis GTPase MnmE n=1 Tax=Sanyastnella coralliicola TaxID=3069118 RepID=UPI0027B8CA7D|nr:tRNA uridine-5-carboxymethylaminomethyl(34) synthesis GTPase MnmE [Longitalea sp. SCSIO 12813]